MKPSTGIGLGAFLGTTFFVIVFALGIVGLLLNLRGIVPSPEQYAAATATAQRAADESLRYNHETTATVTYLQKRIEALPTQVPSDIESENRTKQSISWFVVGAILIGLLAGFVIVGVVRLQGQFVSRGEDGQAKIRAVGNMTVDTQRMIGPAVSVQETGARDQFWHVIRGTPLPTPKIVTSDAGASAEQLLIAAKTANQTTAIAALMSGDITTADRQSRLKLVKENPVKDQFGNVLAPGSTSIVVDGPAVQAICENLGVTLVQGGDAKPALPNPDYPQIEAPIEEPSGAVSVWTEAGAAEK